MRDWKNSPENIARLRAFNRKNHLRHGMSHTPTHKTWLGMLQRCNYKHGAAYKNYGGRGIKVCERWLVFENFLEDMGVRPPKMSLDRINNNLGYTKDNCRWATNAQQHANTRKNVNITHLGETLCSEEWGRRIGVAGTIIRRRLALGWPIEKVLSSERFRSLESKHDGPCGRTKALLAVGTRKCASCLCTVPFKLGERRARRGYHYVDDKGLRWDGRLCPNCVLNNRRSRPRAKRDDGSHTPVSSKIEAEQ